MRSADQLGRAEAIVFWRVHRGCPGVAWVHGPAGFGWMCYAHGAALVWRWAHLRRAATVGLGFGWLILSTMVWVWWLPLPPWAAAAIGYAIACVFLIGGLSQKP